MPIKWTPGRNGQILRKVQRSKTEPERNKKRERTQINKIRDEKEEFTTDTTEIRRIIRDYYKKLYAN